MRKRNLWITQGNTKTGTFHTEFSNIQRLANESFAKHSVDLNQVSLNLAKRPHIIQGNLLMTPYSALIF